MVENSAYGVTVQGSAGDRLEPDYNMENNPLYEMRSLSNDTHSHKTQTTAPVASPCVSLSVTKCCKFTHIKNVNKTCTFLNFDPVGGRHGGIIFQKTPTKPLKWSVGT